WPTNTVTRSVPGAPILVCFSAPAIALRRQPASHVLEPPIAPPGITSESDPHARYSSTTVSPHLYAGNFGRQARRERSSPALGFAAETNSAAPIPYAAGSLFLPWNRFLINKNGRSTAKCRIDARAIATASCAADTSAKLRTSMT